MQDKTSEYYLKSAGYWLKKVGTDLKNKDLCSLRIHLKDMNEALAIAKIAKKKGD